MASKLSARHGGPGSIPVPFDSTDDRENIYTKVLPRPAFISAVDKAPVKKIPIDGLVATQPTVAEKGVEGYMRGEKASPGRRNDVGLLTDKPLVVQRDGVRYIHDGHHRLTADKLEGKQEAEVRLLDLDDPVTTRTPLASWARRRSA